jgi:hypothetical protein
MKSCIGREPANSIRQGSQSSVRTSGDGTVVRRKTRGGESAPCEAGRLVGESKEGWAHGFAQGDVPHSPERERDRRYAPWSGGWWYAEHSARALDADPTALEGEGAQRAVFGTRGEIAPGCGRVSLEGACGASQFISAPFAAGGSWAAGDLISAASVAGGSPLARESSSFPGGDFAIAQGERSFATLVLNLSISSSSVLMFFSSVEGDNSNRNPLFR